MAVLERHIQQVAKGEWEAYREREKKYEALEGRLGGFPAKRHYRALACPHDMDTAVWEREWESFTVAEAAYRKMGQDPETAALAADSPILSERVEFYSVLD